MSKRDISTLNEAALDAKYVKVVVYARLDFSGGVKRFHTEIGSRTAVHPVYGSESYDGIGDFGGIGGEVKEVVNGAPMRIELVLSGLSSALKTSAFTENYFRREAEIMIGLEDETGAAIDDPEILFSGLMDECNLSLDHGSATMILSLESRETNLLSSSDLRVTDEDLQAENSGDLLFEYVYAMEDMVLRWGSNNVVYGSGSGKTSPKPYTRQR